MAVSSDDIRRAYYDGPAAKNLSLWVTEVQITPPQLIVGDEAANKIYRVPYSVSPAGEITFADAIEVQVEYQDVAAAVAAIRAAGRPSRGRGGGAAQGKRALASYQVIRAALQRGALPPRSALSWAARIGRGEADPAAIAAMTGTTWLRDENKRVQAHSNSQLADQILALLQSAQSGDDGDDDALPDEFAALFPPTTTRTTLIYDAPDGKGKRPAPRTPDQPVVPPGYSYGTTDNQTNRYASARRDRYDPAVQGITDAEADRLFPGQGRTEAEAIARYRGAVAAGALEPYSDDDLHDLLFGDTTGGAG